MQNHQAHVLKETNPCHFVQLILTPFFRELTRENTGQSTSFTTNESNFEE
jgi:hypothetical protein